MDTIKLTLVGKICEMGQFILIRPCLHNNYVLVKDRLWTAIGKNLNIHKYQQ